MLPLKSFRLSSYTSSSSRHLRPSILVRFTRLQDVREYFFALTVPVTRPRRLNMEEKLTNAIAANLNVTPQQAEILLKTRKPDVDVSPLSARPDEPQPGTVIMVPTPTLRMRRLKVDLNKLNLQFPIKEPRKHSPSGWLPPGGGTESLPFQIQRTTSDNLPVYIEYRHQRTQVFTVVRKFSGDVQALVQELKKVTLGSDVIKRAGEIRIPGHWMYEIREWLYRLGF